VSFFPGVSSSTTFALGTNARSLKLFRLNRHRRDEDDCYDGYDDRTASLSATMIGCYNDLHRGSVYCCSWHGSERVVVTGSNDKTICLIDTTRDDAQPASLRAHNGTIRAVKFAKEGDLNKFVSGGAGDCIIRVWDAERARTIGELAGSDAPVHALAWCGRDLLLSGAESGALALWDVRDQRAVWSVNTLAGKGIFSISWDDHASNRAVTGHADGLCVGWDLRQRKIFAEKQLHNADCRSMDFFPNLSDTHLPPAERRMIALSASFDGTISASQVVNGFQIQSTMVGHEDKVLCAELHRSSGIVLSCGADAQVLAWRLYV
jgi:WD40 repeat protein